MHPSYNMQHGPPAEIMANILSYKTSQELYDLIKLRTKSVHYHAQMELFRRSDDRAYDFQLKLTLSWLRHIGEGKKLSFLSNEDNKYAWRKLLEHCMQNKTAPFMQKLCYALLLNHIALASSLIKPEEIAAMYANEAPHLQGLGPQFTALFAPYFDDKTLSSYILKIYEQIKAEGKIYVPNNKGGTDLHQWSWTGYETLPMIAPFLKPAHAKMIAQIFIVRIQQGYKNINYSYHYPSEIKNACNAISQMQLNYPEKELRELFALLTRIVYHQDTQIRSLSIKALKNLVKQLSRNTFEQLLDDYYVILQGDINLKTQTFRHLSYLAAAFNESQISAWVAIIFEAGQNKEYHETLYAVLETLAPLCTLEQATEILNLSMSINMDTMQQFKLIRLFNNVDQLDIMPLLLEGLKGNYVEQYEALKTIEALSLSRQQLLVTIPFLVQHAKHLGRYSPEKTLLLSKIINKFSPDLLQITDDLLWNSLNNAPTHPFFIPIFSKLNKNARLKWIPKVIDILIHSFSFDLFQLIEPEFTQAHIHNLLVSIESELNPAVDVSSSMTEHNVYDILILIAPRIPVIQVSAICALLRAKVGHRESFAYEAACKALMALTNHWPEAEAQNSYKALRPNIYSSGVACKAIAELLLKIDNAPINNTVSYLLFAMNQNLQILATGTDYEKQRLNDKFINATISSLVTLFPHTTGENQAAIVKLVGYCFQHPFLWLRGDGSTLLPKIFAHCTASQQNELIAILAQKLLEKNQGSRAIFKMIQECLVHLSTSHIAQLLPLMRGYIWDSYDHDSKIAQKTLGMMISHISSFERLMKQPQADMDADMKAILFVAQIEQACRPAPVRDAMKLHFE